jgi:hypothetical protein
MSDSDQLRAAFDDLHAAVLPQLRPPGAAAVRQTVQHRRSVRLGGGAAAVAVLVLVAAVVLPRQHGPTADMGSPTSSTAPSAGVSRSPSPSATPSDTGPSTSVLGDDTSTTQSRTSKSSPYCPTDWLVDYTEPYDNGWVGLSARLDGADLSCSGGQIRVFWASYTIDGAGVQHLAQSETTGLDRSRPTAQMHIRLPRDCDVAWYLVIGEMPLLPTIRGTGGYQPKGLERGRVDYEIRHGCPSGGPKLTPPTG